MFHCSGPPALSTAIGDRMAVRAMIWRKIFTLIRFDDPQNPPLVLDLSMRHGTSFIAAVSMKLKFIGAYDAVRNGLRFKLGTFYSFGNEFSLNSCGN